MSERFIGEDIKPVVATMDTSRMAAGEQGVLRLRNSLLFDGRGCGESLRC